MPRCWLAIRRKRLACSKKGAAADPRTMIGADHDVAATRLGASRNKRSQSSPETAKRLGLKSIRDRTDLGIETLVGKFDDRHPVREHTSSGRGPSTSTSTMT
jgi:hypothetical protein